MCGLKETRELIEFSFESLADPNLPGAALLRLARQVTAANVRAGLGGQMILEDGRFVQTVEGSARVVLPLAGRILADPRHRAIRVVFFGAIPARRFGNWSATGFPVAEVCAGEPVGNLCRMPERLDDRRTASAVVLGIGAGRRLTAAGLPDA